MWPSDIHGSLSAGLVPQQVGVATHGGPGVGFGLAASFPSWAVFALLAPPQRAQYQDKLARQRYEDQLKQQVSSA